MPKSKEQLQDMKVARDIRDMMQTDGWKHYSRILQFHIDAKIRVAFEPMNEFMEIDGIKHILLGESAKGAIMGLRLALSLPSGIIMQYKDSPSFAESET